MGMTIICGIDPGLSGALAFLDHRGELLALDDIPTMQNPDAGRKTTIKREVDVLALRDLLRLRIPADEEALVFLEHVSTVGGRGTQAMLSLASTKAAIASVARLLYLPINRVHPAAWKRFYGLDGDKVACLEKARELYPDAPLTRAKDHNRAEALLIARWAQRNLT
jgi:hypothetical protein